MSCDSFRGYVLKYVDWSESYVRFRVLASYVRKRDSSSKVSKKKPTTFSTSPRSARRRKTRQPRTPVRRRARRPPPTARPPPRTPSPPLAPPPRRRRWRRRPRARPPGSGRTPGHAVAHAVQQTARGRAVVHDHVPERRAAAVHASGTGAGDGARQILRARGNDGGVAGRIDPPLRKRKISPRARLRIVVGVLRVVQRVLLVAALRRRRRRRRVVVRRRDVVVVREQRRRSRQRARRAAAGGGVRGDAQQRAAQRQRRACPLSRARAPADVRGAGPRRPRRARAARSPLAAALHPRFPRRAVGGVVPPPRRRAPSRGRPSRWRSVIRDHRQPGGHRLDEVVRRRACPAGTGRTRAAATRTCGPR